MLDTIQFTEAKTHLSEVMDDVVHKHHLRAIRRKSNEVALILTPEMASAFIPEQKFVVDYMPEEDGTMTVWLHDLNIAVNAPTPDEARTKLIADVKSFVSHYFRAFDRYRHASNMIAIAPQVAKLAVAPDDAAIAKMLFGA